MKEQNSINFDRITQAIGYLKDNFKEQPNLDEVAEKVHLSPFHFHKLFTNWAGISPKKFVQYLSIEHAKKYWQTPLSHYLTLHTGGEFVLTEQVPRAQSKAIVVATQQGDMIIFTINFRPVKGSKGYHRANMKHGVSEVQSGRRMAMGIIFHNAVS